jgi:DUF4097 and DUF4098 domain-containing protein YvlB
MKTSWLLLAGCCLLAGENKTFEVGANPRLQLANVAGDIAVAPGKSGEIRIEYEKSREEIEVVFEQQGDVVEVEVKYPSRHSGRGEVSFVVTIPPNTQVELESVSGNIRAGELGGGGKLESVSGNVTLRKASGEFELGSVSGNLILEESAGTFRLGSVSGNVTATGLGKGQLSMESVSGNLRLESATLAGSYDLESTSGSVLIRHGKDASYRADVETFSGDLDYPRTAGLELKEGKYTPEKSLKGSYNGETGSLRCETLSGNIRIQVE